MKYALIIALLIALPAHAEFLSGNKLHESCTARDTVNQMDCLGYISGVHDALAGVTICLPQSVTRGQIMDVTVRWLNANPDKRHLSADQAVNAALSSIWPCSSRQSGRSS